MDNEEYLENHCPEYRETSECTNAVKRWEAQKLGRVPEFVYKNSTLEPEAYGARSDTMVWIDADETIA